MGSGDDGAHSQNEKIELRNYIEGVCNNSLQITIINILYIFKLTHVLYKICFKKFFYVYNNICRFLDMSHIYSICVP